MPAILSYGLVLGLLAGAYTSSVFLQKRSALGVLWKPKNLEQECGESHCSKEESREIFKDDKKTETFWADYIHGHNSHVVYLLETGSEILSEQKKINELQTELAEQENELLDLEAKLHLKIKQLWSQ
ncbi:coagulation factor IX-like [Rhinoraja longicauda]